MVNVIVNFTLGKQSLLNEIPRTKSGDFSLSCCPFCHNHTRNSVTLPVFFLSFRGLCLYSNTLKLLDPFLLLDLRFQLLSNSKCKWKYHSFLVSKINSFVTLKTHSHYIVLFCCIPCCFIYYLPLLILPLHSFSPNSEEITFL